MLYLRYDLEVPSAELADRLRTDQSVLVVPGEHFGMENWVRIGFGSETGQVEEGLKRIPTGGAVTYGMDSVANAAQQGAVEALVIVASMLRSGDDASRVRWEDIVAQVEASRGSVIQASTDHDAGQQLVGLGGAIALLRWKVE